MLGRPAGSLPVMKNVIAGARFDRRRVERLHEAELVGDLGGMREEIGDPRAGLAVLRGSRSLIWSRDARFGRRSSCCSVCRRRLRRESACRTVQHRLVVERADVRAAGSF